MARFRREGDQLKPGTVQTGGWVMLVVFAIFYFLTGQQSSLFVGVAASFILLGNFSGAVDTIAKKYGYSKDTERKSAKPIEKDAPDA